MAKVETRVALDMTPAGQLNFANLLDGRDARFNNSLIRLDYEKTQERDTFYGSFSANVSAKTISGTAKSWVHSKKGHWQWEISRASISATEVVAAARSKTIKDDKVLIAKIFAGNDSITGSKFADKLFGYDGNDTIAAGGGTDRIDGGNGHDRVSFENSNQSVELALTGATLSYAVLNGVQGDKVFNMEDAAGGNGNDKFTGDSGANLLIGNSGNDTLIGGKGNDTLLGGKNNDSLVGGKGNDLLDGGKHSDWLSGGAGNDKLLGGEGAGADYLSGDGGNDTLDAGGGADTLLGGAGNDSLLAGAGNDSASGGGGNDKIDGAAGLDTIEGGAGKDTMTGGLDADVFRFVAVGDSTTTASGRDFITDFKHKTDKIDLSAIDAVTSLVGGDDAFIRDAKGGANTAVAEGHFGWYTVNAAGTANDRTYIRINNDGDAAIDMTIELQGVIKLTNVDFIL